MSASYVRCASTPTQCDRHIVLSLTHHAMLQGGLETLRVADYLWKREERGTNINYQWALFCQLHSWSQSLSPTQSLRLAPLLLTDDIIHPSFPLPCMELPVLTLQRRTWNMPYFGLRRWVDDFVLFVLAGNLVSSSPLWRKLARSLIQGCSVVGNTRRSRHEKRA